MAGFMNAGLGFTSTAGAFIGGFAKQLNQNIENAQALQTAGDQAWGIKVDKAAQDFNKQYSQDKSNIDLYNYFKTQTGGDPFLADQMYQRYQANPRADIGKIQDDVMRGAGSTYKQDPNYKSTVISGIQSRQGALYNQLQEQMNRLSPRVRSRITQPLDPNVYGDRTTLGNTPGVSAPQAPSVGLPGVGDNVVPGGDTTPTLGPQSSNESNEPFKMVGITNPDITPTGSMAFPAAEDNPNIQQAQINYKYQPRPANNQTALDPMNPQHWGNYANRAALEQGLILNGVPPQKAHQIASGAITAEEKLQNEIKAKGENKESPEDKQALAIGQSSAEKYLGDPKTGLEYRMSSVGNQVKMAQEATSIVKQFENGLKANAVQPLADSIGRLLSPFGVDLHAMGLSNDVTDINTFKKNLGNLTFDQISQYHLGRWTNFEVDLLRSKLPALGNDPDTDVRIAIALQNGALRQARDTAAEYAAVYGENGEFYNRPRVGMGRSYQLKSARELVAEGDKAPWHQVNGSDPNDKKIVQQMPIGEWFEDTNSHRMLRILSRNNGTTTIADAYGNQRQLQ